MKEHFCPAEQSVITYQDKCNWCGEREALAQTQEPFEDLATELFAVAQISPADDGFSETIERIESWLREHFTHPPQRTEPVAFKIYKPTPPRHAIPNVRDAELPWVYDQDPSSGNVASMWVTPVKHTHPPQRTEQEPVCPECKAIVLYECVACSSNNYPPKTEQEPVAWINILGAVARGWTHEYTKHKEMDAPLALAIAKEIQEMLDVQPQRTWVGLTDDEYAELAQEYGPFPINQIEAKLKEKNT